MTFRNLMKIENRWKNNQWESYLEVSHVIVVDNLFSKLSCRRHCIQIFTFCFANVGNVENYLLALFSLEIHSVKYTEIDQAWRVTWAKDTYYVGSFIL